MAAICSTGESCSSKLSSTILSEGEKVSSFSKEAPSKRRSSSVLTWVCASSVVITASSCAPSTGVPRMSTKVPTCCSIDSSSPEPIFSTLPSASSISKLPSPSTRKVIFDRAADSGASSSATSSARSSSTSSSGSEARPSPGPTKEPTPAASIPRFCRSGTSSPSAAEAYCPSSGSGDSWDPASTPST